MPSSAQAGQPHANGTPPSSLAKEGFHAYPWWSPRFWHGMPLGVWMGLLAEHRWRASPTRWPLVGTITAASAFNSIATPLSRARYARQLREAEPRPDPLFIIGHWRSGTTLLHEMLMLDERFFCPTTYQCFAPGHFLLTESLLTRALSWIMPAKRPMDNVEAGWHRPQEDEFALVNLGADSPYRRMAFPATASNEPVALDIERLSPEARRRWEATFHDFLRSLVVRDPRRPVLKSPPHTARMRVLLEMFPEARFLHIVRDPLVVFPSTMRLWRSLDHVQGLQVDSGERLEAYVLETFVRMYEAFERDRPSIPPDRLHEIRYEDLIENPVGLLETAYEQLALGDFETMRPAFVRQAERMRGYRRNRYALDEATAAKVGDRWAGFFDRYGYRFEPAGADERR